MVRNEKQTSDSKNFVGVFFGPLTPQNKYVYYTVTYIPICEGEGDGVYFTYNLQRIFYI